MFQKSILILLTLIVIVLSASCSPRQVSPTPVTNMANPASVYCEQNGNKLQIHTAADGSQNGICVFPNDSTCDEWAYYRGQCGHAEQKSPIPAMTVEIPTEANGGTDGQASGGYIQPGTTEKIIDWWGIIHSTKPGAQYDDYFERQDLGQIIYFGIDSIDPAVQAQIKALRDSGKIVHLYGTLLSNVPDYNGSQVQVDRIEVEG